MQRHRLLFLQPLRRRQGRVHHAGNLWQRDVQRGTLRMRQDRPGMLHFDHHWLHRRRHHLRGGADHHDPHLPEVRYGGRPLLSRQCLHQWMLRVQLQRHHRVVRLDLRGGGGRLYRSHARLDVHGGKLRHLRQGGAALLPQQHLQLCLHRLEQLLSLRFADGDADLPALWGDGSGLLRRQQHVRGAGFDRRLRHRVHLSFLDDELHLPALRSAAAFLRRRGHPRPLQTATDTLTL